ncbi:MAG: PfkB family carbohydrate kinase [Candidatus Lernaella stagnicola]|nr:PfkB family carbohydrate kinase [Candidatus Lernaella stagnicola]
MTRIFENFTTTDLDSLLERISASHVGVLGDFALDVYVFVDRDANELSLETGLPVQPVLRYEVALGGAGNVANNLADLKCRHVEAFGVLGDDPWGREIQRLLALKNVRIDDLLTQQDAWATVAYLKPYEGETEKRRFDFGFFNRLSTETADRLLERVAARLPELDALIVNEQVGNGIHSPYLRGKLRELLEAHRDKIVIVDSRNHSEAYPAAILKINDHEAARLAGYEYPVGALVLKENALEAARLLHRRIGRPVFITRGARGLIVADESGLQEIPGIQVLGRIDPVGAGDATLAGIASALAVGATAAEAAVFGNIVAAITVLKLRQTGTATPAEVLAVGAQPDYVYRPELAEDPRAARILPGTEFELIGERQPPPTFTHAIFDHDGTISTLREGWETIMEPMMARAILGPSYQSANDSLYHRVVDRVREYIDKSTGVQTLVQMQGLVAMVREFDLVPEDEVLDEHGYKEIFNAELLRLVRQRVAKLERGELEIADFTMKNAVALLHALHQKGVKLYLASGTDAADVKREAAALGYAELFEGRIHGAVGDAAKEVKRLVLDRILREIGDAASLITFGDGPLEIRETHKRGGYTVGVASDELRRFSLNAAKRSRLVRAGVDLIVPDFSQLDALLAYLQVRT